MKKDYTTSITLAKHALETSPDYTDISIFLGRVYTWNKDLESARAVFDELEKRTAIINRSTNSSIAREKKFTEVASTITLFRNESLILSINSSD